MIASSGWELSEEKKIHAKEFTKKEGERLGCREGNGRSASRIGQRCSPENIIVPLGMREG